MTPENVRAEHQRTTAPPEQRRQCSGKLTKLPVTKQTLAMLGLAPTGCWLAAWPRATGLAYGWLPLVPDNLSPKNQGYSQTSAFIGSSCLDIPSRMV